MTLVNAATGTSSVTINVTDSSGQSVPQYSNSTGGVLDQVLNPPIRLTPNANARIAYSFSSQSITTHKYKFVTASSVNAADKPAFPADSAMIDLTIPAANSAEAYGTDIGKQGYVSVKHYYYAGKSSSTGLPRDISFGNPIGTTMLEQPAVASNDLSENTDKTANAFLNNITAYNGSTPSKYAALKAMKVWGYFKPTVTGNYQLGAYSDDGAYGYLMVNGVKTVFVDDWSIAAAFNRTNSTSIPLEAGKYYPIYMEWYEGCATQAAFIPIYKIKNGNGNSWPNNWNNIDSTQLYSSKTTTPGDSADAYFADASGIDFPAQDGVYYLATKFVTGSGNPSGLYGPFIVDNTLPVINNLNVVSNNTGGNVIATNGNNLAISFTASETLRSIPQVKINGSTPIATLTAGANNTYTMTVPISSSGTIGVTKINSDGSVGSTTMALLNGPIVVQVSNYSDLSGNAGGPFSDSDVIFDNVAPSVALTYSASPVSSGTETITANYSEPVSTSDTPKVSITQQGTAKITLATMSGSSDRKTWTYNYTVVADDGNAYKDGIATVTLNTTHDQAGNTAGSPANTNFDIKTKAMLATLTFSADPVKAGTEVITASYSEAVKDTETPKILVSQQGTATMVATNMTLASTDRKTWIYNYTVNTDNNGTYKDGKATVTLSSVTDTFNVAVPNPSVNSFLIDTKAPTVNLTYTTTNAKAGINKITATYNEAVADWLTPLVSVTQQGSANITLAPMSGSIDRKIWTYDYNVNTHDGAAYIDGTATVSLSSVTDQAGNVAANPSGTTFNIDTTPPTFTVSNPSMAVTKSGPVTYTVTYNAGDIINLKSSNVSLAKAGTADGEVTASVNGGIGTITVFNITGDGTLSVDIAAGTVTDAAGNNALALTGTKSFKVDNTALAPIINSPIAPSPTNNNKPTITGTAEANTTVTVYDGAATIGIVTSDSTGKWSLTPTTALIDGTHSITATVTDAVGNLSPPSSAVGITIFTKLPTITLLATTNNNSAIVNATINAIGNGNGISEKKYAIGDQDVSYFIAGGTSFSENTFTVSPQGTYTVFCKDYAGNTAVQTIVFNYQYSMINTTVTANASNVANVAYFTISNSALATAMQNATKSTDKNNGTSQVVVQNATTTMSDSPLNHGRINMYTVSGTQKLDDQVYYRTITKNGKTQIQLGINVLPRKSGANANFTISVNINNNVYVIKVNIKTIASSGLS